MDKTESFQTYDDRSDAATVAPRLAALRAELASRGLDGFVVPHADEHQNEYLPANAERLAWLTSFTGSAGAAVVLTDKAAVFVDGRYTLQAGAQVETGSFEIRHLIEEPPAEWLGAALKEGGVVAYDPWLHTPHEVERFRGAAEKAGAEFRAQRGQARRAGAGIGGVVVRLEGLIHARKLTGSVFPIPARSRDLPAARRQNAGHGRSW